MKRQIKIGEIAEINANSLTQKDMFQEIMYLDTGNITRNEIDNIQILNITMDKIPSRAKRKVKDKTIIYSTVRPNQEHYGFLENPSDNFIVSTGFSTIDVYDDNTDEKFIYYLLTQKHVTDYLHTIGENSVSSYPSINPDDIANLKFTVPDLKTQQSIAAVLSALDKKIALNKQINARLEEMAKTLYDYWFVQFDFPDANGKSYKSSGGEMVFDETLKRKIPKGWEVKQISHWIKADKSGDWGKEQQEGNYTVKVNCVRGADINAINSQGNIEAPIRFILAKNEHKLLSPFDFVVEISGGSPTQSTGRLAPISQYVLDRFDLPLICSNFCKAISLKDTSYFYQFAFMWSDIYKNNILFGWEGKTSGIKNLLFDNFVNGYFECFPPKEIAEQFFKIIDKNHQEQQLLLKQNHQLTQLRDFLLPMLMNGQVSVAKENDDE